MKSYVFNAHLESLNNQGLNGLEIYSRGQRKLNDHCVSLDNLR